MPDVNSAFASFGGGQVSPRMRYRLDLEDRGKALRLCKNWFVRTGGGIERRPGFIYKDAPGSAFKRLIPFNFNTEQRYLLALSPTEIKVYRDGVERATMTSPWDSDELDEIQWTQSADILFVAQNDVYPKQIERDSDTSWSIEDFAFVQESEGAVDRLHQPHTKYEPNYVTLTPSATTGTITLTASDDLFEAGHVGVRFRIGGGSERPKELIITAVTDAKTATADVRETLASTDETDNWTEAAMSSVRGYPAACAIYQQRFAFGGYRSRPVNISLSRIGDLWKFENQDVDETVANDHAMDLGLTSLQVNPVVWMNNSTQGLLAGTTGGEFLVQGDTGTLGFGPEDNDISQQSDWGTAVGVRPIRVGASHVFVQRGRRHLQELVFDFEADSFINRDLAALIDDLFENEAKRVEIQEGIESRIWVLFNDGSLGALTFEARQKVFAWGTVETDGTFVDICALPDHDGNDELWALIDRDGGRTLELLGDEYPLKGGDLTSVANFLDSGVYGTPGSATITGIPSHLEGVAVRVVGDGVDYGTKTVSGGSITLPKSVDTVRLGLTYTSRAEGMPLVAQAGTANSSIGLRKRISSIAVSGVNTEDLKAGTGDASPILVKGMHNYNSSYEGVRAEPDDKFAAEKYWVLQADGPRPATVTSVSVIWEFHAK